MLVGSCFSECMADCTYVRTYDLRTYDLRTYCVEKYVDNSLGEFIFASFRQRDTPCSDVRDIKNLSRVHVAALVVGDLLYHNK